MGMIQYYLRADDAKVKEIQEGDSVFHSSSDDDKMLDIDKAWHAIHFTLTGEVWELDEDNFWANWYLVGNLSMMMIWDMALHDCSQKIL